MLIPRSKCCARCRARLVSESPLLVWDRAVWAARQHRSTNRHVPKGIGRFMCLIVRAMIAQSAGTQNSHTKKEGREVSSPSPAMLHNKSLQLDGNRLHFGVV